MYRDLVVQILILAVLLLVVPAVVGNLVVFTNLGETKNAPGLLLRWVSGQFILWAGFQIICVPMVLSERRFEDVVKFFLAYTAVLTLSALAVCVRRQMKSPRRPAENRDIRKSREEVLLWLIFWGLLLFQLVQAVRMAYADGDDAYYVAVSTITENSETMYRKLPYTGGTTSLDVRHGLAPFPIWIAFLARISGMHAVSVTQIILPIVLISITYAIFYLLGGRLFSERDSKLPFFLVFTEILVLFGDCSFQAVENFMIARSAQGKAVLGSIVIPYVLYVLLLLCLKLKEKQKISPALYVLLTAAAFAGCLCSTLGSLLLCMLIGIVGLIAAFVYKRWKVLFPMAACCLPCICYALIYLAND